MGWPFDRKKHPVIGEEVGQATVTDRGRRVIHLHFFPKHVHVCFTDPEPERPGCAPMEPDMVQITANHKMLEITWNVQEPREIKWTAKS